MWNYADLQSRLNPGSVLKGSLLERGRAPYVVPGNEMGPHRLTV